jgi:hypothetical protein
MSIEQLYKTNTQFDAQGLLEVYKSLDNSSNQIMITSRGSSDLKDGIGSIFNYLPDDEWKWDQLHSIFKGTVVEDAYEYIKKDWHVGRVRFMRMHTSNRALSFHYDDSFRLHIPIITNKDSWFMNEDNSMHQMDKLGHLYYLDATRNHSALMLSRNEDRVHVVFSVKGK